MAETVTKIGKGDYVAVVYGSTGEVKEYLNHPAVVMVDAKKRVLDLQSKIPQETKAIIMTEGIDHLNYMWVTSFCRTRQIPWILRKSNQAVYDMLKSMLQPVETAHKPTSEEVRGDIVKGKLVPLISLIDFTKSNSENATTLLRKAHELNIRSTHGSLAQFVANQRRKHSGTGLPKSARSKLDVSVELLDDYIRGLTDMRDFLIATCEENRLLRAKQEQFRKLME